LSNRFTLFRGLRLLGVQEYKVRYGPETLGKGFKKLNEVFPAISGDSRR